MKSLRTIFCVMVLGAILTLALIGCAPKETVATETSSKKVALLVLGRIDDHGWDQAFYEGLMLAKEKYGIETAYIETVPEADTEKYVREFASRGFDLIIGADFPFQDAIFKVAADYPKTWFAWAGSGQTAPNVVTTEVHAQDCAYLAGMLAARMSKTGVIAGVKGYDVPDIIRDINGYKLGARAVNPNIIVKDVFTYDWQDPVKAKDATLSLIAEKADVFYVDGNPKDEGVFAAAKEKGLYAIGSVGDQYALSPSVLLTSVIYGHPETVVKIVGDLVNGTIKSATYNYSMKDGGCHLAPYHDFESKIPDSVKAEIEKAKQDILDGKIVVTDTVEMID